MANYFLKNVSLLPDPAVDASVLSGIPDWRKHYILRYRNPIDRKRSLGAWRLLEEALEKLLLLRLWIMFFRRGNGNISQTPKMKRRKHGVFSNFGR